MFKKSTFHHHGAIGVKGGNEAAAVGNGGVRRDGREDAHKSLGQHGIGRGVVPTTR